MSMLCPCACETVEHVSIAAYKSDSLPVDQKLNELNKLTIEVGGKLSLEYNCTKGTTHGSILIKPDLG